MNDTDIKSAVFYTLSDVLPFKYFYYCLLYGGLTKTARCFSAILWPLFVLHSCLSLVDEVTKSKMALLC